MSPAGQDSRLHSRASQLTYVQHSLQQIKERPKDQEYLSTVHDTVTDLAIGVVDLETARENFNKNVLQPFLEERSAGKSAVISMIPWVS